METEQIPYSNLAKMTPVEYEAVGVALPAALLDIVRPVATRPVGSTAVEEIKFGSGQVLRVGDLLILVTAGHNLKDGRGVLEVGLLPDGSFEPHEIRWLGASRGQVNATYVELTHKVTGEKVRAELDVGIVEITESEAIEHKFTPISLDQVADRTLEHGDIAVVFGYPGALYERLGGMKVRPMFMHFTSVGHRADEWAPGWVPGLHQVVLYPDGHTTRTTREGKADHKLPDPRGISGCAIWALPERPGKLFSYKEAQMVGIQYVHNGTRELLLGNAMGPVLRVIAEVVPGAREIITAYGHDVGDSP